MCTLLSAPLFIILKIPKVYIQIIFHRGIPPVKHCSQYALGVLTGQYKARTNLALIAEIRDLMTNFSALEILKVKGHAGDPCNERADALARKGVAAGKSKPA